MSEMKPLSDFVKACREALDAKDWPKLQELLAQRTTREPVDWAKRAAGEKDE